MSAYIQTGPIPSASFDKLIPSPEAVACLPESFARRLLCVPVARKTENAKNRDELVLATLQPDDPVLYERVIRQLPIGMSIHFVLADEDAIHRALEKCYSHSLQGNNLLAACSLNSLNNDDPLTALYSTTALVESILLCAHRERASDIHISPCVDGVRVRFRIDGVLVKRSILHKRYYPELVGRVKILAKMDTAIARLPQDGQFTQFIDNELVDFRTSIFPLVNGENIVIRVLRPTQARCGIDALELPEKLRSQLQSCLHEPSGLIVFCGPTGSGKSTSMHALLSELDRDSLNIMTLEDPVEKILPGIQQTSIDASRSLGYGEGLRAVMRQDPDVVLIGEVRDASSCQMMLRAVMTGHSVLTTVHAKNVFGAIDRMVELGVNRGMLSSHLLCIAAQRLVRKNCYCCSGNDSSCVVCLGSGFYGRQAIVELLLVTQEVASLIGDGADHKTILAEAERFGFITLQEQGASLVKRGLSTNLEMCRVFGSSTLQA